MSRTPDAIDELDNFRARLFFVCKTNGWAHGDLLMINDKPTIFLWIKLYDERVISHLGEESWFPRNGVVVVFDGSSMREIDANEFSNVKKTIKVINRHDTCQ